MSCESQRWIEERARLREERKIAAELAEERARLDKERTHMANALEALRSGGGSDPELERRERGIRRVPAERALLARRTQSH